LELKLIEVKTLKLDNLATISEKRKTQKEGERNSFGGYILNSYGLYIFCC